MTKITNEIVHAAYEVAKDIFKQIKTRSEGLKILTDMRMNNSSANYYIYHYAYFRTGELFTGTINSYATDYYLKKILEEQGKKGLETALLSLSQHLDYYEEKSNAKSNKRRLIYNKYLKLIVKESENNYPNEVDPNTTYSEGKTKKVLVNSYERNPIARKKCLEHFGLNCQVCDLNFEEKYGTIGKKFIHVHHKLELSSIGKEYSINPTTDLIPVCPNCHSMLHKKNPAYTVTELKAMIN